MSERLCSDKCLGGRNTAYNAVPRWSSIESPGSQELAGGLMDSKGTEIVAPHLRVRLENSSQTLQNLARSFGNSKTNAESIVIEFG